jgi:hypothetical protein
MEINEVQLKVKIKELLSLNIKSGKILYQPSVKFGLLMQKIKI